MLPCPDEGPPRGPHRIDASSLVGMLWALRSGPRTFSGLHAAGGIRFKRSYIRYLRFGQARGLVRREEAGRLVYYSLTDKGASLVRILSP